MSIFKQFFYSLYNFQVVTTFRFYYNSIVIRYTLLLAVILFLPQAVANIQDFSKLRRHVDEFLTNPSNDIYIKDEILGSNFKKGTSFTFSNGLTLLFDPQDTISEEIATSRFGDHIHFGSKKISVFTISNQNEFTYGKIGLTTDISKETLRDVISQNLFWNVLYAFGFVFSYLNAVGSILFLSVIVALLGRVISSLMFIKLTYAETWRLTVYASTIPYTYTSLLNFLKVPNNFMYNVVWFITILILIFIFRCLKKMNKPNANKT